ncbi:MAG: primosomal protein N' [Isosphaera sp.]|nr:primosomal protein N' [Isosphaera sp.]
MHGLFDGNQAGLAAGKGDGGGGDGVYAVVAVRRGIDRVGGGAARGGGDPRGRTGRGGGDGGRGGGGAAAPRDAAEGGLSYAVPAGMTLRVGELVTVPLGSASTTGVVLRVGGPELLGGVDRQRVRAVAVAHGSALPASVLELARWMSRYYVCPLGMVMPAVVPGAVQRGVGRRTRRVLGLDARASQIAGQAGLSPRARGALARAIELPAEAWPIEPSALGERLGVGAGVLRRLVSAGALVEGTRLEVRAGPGRSGPTPATEAVRTAPPTATAEQASAIAGVTGTLGGYAAHLVFGVTGSGKTEVYLRAIEAMMRRDPEAGAIVLVPEIALTPQTERRFVERFGAGTVAVLHSGLTAAQRHAYWTACAGHGSAAVGGGPRVVVGARSAVFAPLPRVGLIVVDEEHDGSYKQDQLPRYHARDVAIKRAHLEGCPVVLGSATPSLESWWNAGGGGDQGAGGGGGVARYTLHRLLSRATGARLPTVRVVDLLEEARERARGPGNAGSGWRDGHVHLIGPTLERELDRTLGAGGQAILLLNRRGYANYICCATSPRCAWVMRCAHCDVTAVYHTDEAQRGRGGPAGVVRCHHCLGETLLPGRCPVCAAGVNTFGMGTQRVEAELARKLGHRRGLEPGVSMVRADADSMRGGARAYFDVLGRFGRGEVRVLLGTQMIAKGLDFANVRLVGVVQADTALALPDFRASERTFQLVAQVAGRAGRAGGDAPPGLVIVQTLRPDEPAIVLASRHDYESFAAAELAVRRMSGLPPAWRMARVVCRDTDPAKAVARGQAVRGALDAASAALGLDAAGLRLRGPHPCPIARIDDHHRQEVIIQAGGSRRGAGVIQHLLGHARERGLLVSDAHTAVDVDPVMVL